MEASTTTAECVNNSKGSTKGVKRWSRFVFTVNNWTQEEWDSLKQTAIQMKWWIMGKEKAPDTGTPHLQGACVIGKQLAMTSIKKLPGLERAHLEMMRGSPIQSREYCTKDGDFFEHGVLPKPGERNDLAIVAKRIMNGATMTDLANDDMANTFIIKYSKGLTALRSYVAPTRDPTKPPIVVWIFGPTGTNKTRTAFEASKRFSGQSPWISNGGLTWFDGYDGQSTVIIDDYRTGDCKWNFLLRLLDRYPIRVPYKGGFTEWAPSLIFITAPYGHKEMWNYKTPEALSQLTRRISMELTSPEELPRVYEMLFHEDQTFGSPGLPILLGDAIDEQQQPQLGQRNIRAIDPIFNNPMEEGPNTYTVLGE